MNDTSAKPRPSFLQANENCPRDKEINILLLGQTGIGKTTFINSFANYLVNDTLDDAINDQTPVIIPTSFTFTDPNTFEETRVSLGGESKRENGQTGTQQCQSFVFPIGARNLRLIDTPGMGDTRGSEQDNKNLFEILTFTSYYEHLNGICIFLKPNEERLTIAFRLCVKQILHYLNVSASENIMFIFTNARSTFFIPGSSKKLLQVLLNNYQTENKSQIPFSRENTFLLDNETLRYIALRKHGIDVDDDQIQNYRKSWESSGREYERLLTYVNTRELLAVRETLSLNEAEQLIRKLARPIAETIRLIQQNIQLAKEYQQNPSRNTAQKGLLEKVVRIVPFPHPRLVCVSKKCLQSNEDNGEKEPDHYHVCKEKSRLNGVVQETINDCRIAQSKAIDIKSGNCIKCGCPWERHMHITYEFRTELKYPNDQSSSQPIEQRIRDLSEEQAKITDIYEKLSKFLILNAIHPLKDDLLDYLTLFIGEEQLRNNADVQGQQCIVNLKNIMSAYASEMDAFKRAPPDEKDCISRTDPLKAEDVFTLVGALYRLSINGESLRSQINLLKIAEEKVIRHCEEYVPLPHKADSSQNMYTLKDIFSSHTSTRL